MAGQEKWYFTKETLQNSPSRRCGLDADKELAYRQQAANLIQDMGQKLQVSQLCINTAIVYMHRFYAFHSFTQFHRNAIAAATLFLAAKVEEQPRKLEYVIKVAHFCLHRGEGVTALSPEQYQEQAQDLVFNENVLLQTLGFDVAIDHPHTHVVRTCHLVKAPKDLAQTSYFMASNSLHLTTMCLQYRPTVVACFCIHLASKWSNWAIPQSSEGRHWFYYVDRSVTSELLEKLTAEFLHIFDKCPSRLRRKMMTMSNNNGSSPHAPPSGSKAPPAADDFDKSFDKEYEREKRRQPLPGGYVPATAPPPQKIDYNVYREKREKEREERERQRQQMAGRGGSRPPPPPRTSAHARPPWPPRPPRPTLPPQRTRPPSLFSPENASTPTAAASSSSLGSNPAISQGIPPPSTQGIPPQREASQSIPPPSQSVPSGHPPSTGVPRRPPPPSQKRPEPRPLPPAEKPPSPKKRLETATAAVREMKPPPTILSPLYSSPPMKEQRPRQRQQSGSEPALIPVVKKLDETPGFENVIRESQRGNAIKTKSETKHKADPMLPVRALNGIETDPTLVSNLLKESLAKPAPITVQAEKLSPIDREVKKEPPTEPIVPLIPEPLPIPNLAPAEESAEHKPKKDKKKKEKHKHKDRDKSKEERKKHKKDKKKESSPAEDGGLRITIPRDKLATSPGLKIKIPKERLTAPPPPPQPSGLKIKISKEVLETSRKRTGPEVGHSAPPVKMQRQNGASHPKVDHFDQQMGNGYSAK